jgi:hypothetical protein
MLAHQKPSFHQSLLSGFSPVGELWEPKVDGPSNPMSPVAALAAVACADQKTTAPAAARQPKNIRRPMTPTNGPLILASAISISLFSPSVPAGPERCVAGDAIV